MIYNDDCLIVLDELIEKNIKVDAIIADPPYGVLNKRCHWDDVIPLDALWDKLLRIRKDETTPIVLFSQEPFTSKLLLSQSKLFKYKWYWQKTSPNGHLNAQKQPLRVIEEILVFYEKQCTYNPQKTDGEKPYSYTTSKKKSICYGDVNTITKKGVTSRFPQHLLLYKSDTQKSSLHPTQKPIALMEYLIKTYTNEDNLVLDFCMGSGTTCVACQNTKRKFIGIEKDETYFNIAKNRLLTDIFEF